MRRVRAGFSLTCVAMCLASIALLIRSRTHADSVTVKRVDAVGSVIDHYTMQTVGGLLAISYWNLAAANSTSPLPVHATDGSRWAYTFSTDPADAMLEAIAWRWETDVWPYRTWAFQASPVADGLRYVAVPLYVVTVGLAIPPWLWAHGRWGHRRSPGRCSACGYDLRATPDRCPECGLAVGSSRTEHYNAGSVLGVRTATRRHKGTKPRREAREQAPQPSMFPTSPLRGFVASWLRAGS